MLKLLLTLTFLTLALFAGFSVGRAGVITGNMTARVGTFQMSILGRYIAGDFVNFREGKVFYRIVVLPLG